MQSKIKSHPHPTSFYYAISFTIGLLDDRKKYDYTKLQSYKRQLMSSFYDFSSCI